MEENNMRDVLSPMYLKTLEDSGVIDKLVSNNRTCKNCGKKFHADRAGHYLCHDCFATYNETSECITET